MTQQSSALDNKFLNKHLKIYISMHAFLRFRYKDAERLHTVHHNFALNRGDIHGLAISCGNIGFLKFYNPEEFDDSVVYQFIEYSLAEQVGDFARMGIAFNKIGKLYTTLGYNEEAVAMFQIALDVSRRASNVAGEGMAWGNLGTVYRALERFEDAIDCHIKYRDNADRRMDIGGVAIMQHQLAMDYLLSGKLPEAERSILSAFETLEKIRAQIGEEDKSKLSNFEKNQAEAYNLLQVVLVAQLKYKEALVLADTSRGRALAEIVRKRLCGYNSAEKETTMTTTLNEEFIEESFNNLLEVSRKLSTTLVFYSVVKEFNETGAFYNWVYAWVLHPSGRLDFTKSRLKHGIRETKVEVNGEFLVSLRRSMGQPSQIEDLGKILRCEKHPSVSREAKAHVATLQSEDVLNSLKGLEHMFTSGLSLTKAENENTFSLDIPYKTKEKGLHDRPGFQSDTTVPESDTHIGKSFNLEPEETVMEDIGNPSTSQAQSSLSLSTLEGTALNVDQGPDHETVTVHGKVAEQALVTTETLPGSPLTVCLPQVGAVSGGQVETEKFTCSATEEKPKTFEEPTDHPATCPLQETTTAQPGETDDTCLKNNEENSQTETQENQDFLKREDMSEASFCESLNQNELKEESAASDAMDANPNESPQLFESQEETPKHSEGIVSQLETSNSEGSKPPLQGEIHTEVEKNSVTSSCDVPESTFYHSTLNDSVPGPLSVHSKLQTANTETSSRIEVEKDELAPVTATDDVSEGTVPGPFNDVVTEPSGTHSREHDERESDPELDPWRPMLSQLHKVLVEPIVEFLPPKDENPRLTFIPQDFLLKVPFSALQGDAGDHYIMEDFVISTSPAIHFLELACASRESAKHTTAPLELSLLAVGNPIMPFEELPQLPSAQREVRMINEIINSPESQVLIGSRAKKKDVMAAMPKHKILHFATHAIIDDVDSHGDFSMKGLIVLAKSGLECNGILTAEEVRGMELNAELVVLSCCDTGLGKVTGDGVLGEFLNH